MNFKNKKFIVSVVIILIIIGGYFIFSFFQNNVNQTKAKFVSEKYNFSFKYPANWKIYKEDMILTSWKDAPNTFSGPIPKGNSTVFIGVHDKSSEIGKRLLNTNKRSGLTLFPNEDSYSPELANEPLFLDSNYASELADKYEVAGKIQTYDLAIEKGEKVYQVTIVYRGEEDFSKDSYMVKYRDLLQSWSFN